MSSATQGRIVVTAIGAFSPVGGSAEQTAAAVKAGAVAISEYPFLCCTPRDPAWDEDLPMYVSAVPAIGSAITGLERFTQLAIPALTEVLGKAKLTRQSLANTGLLIAIPQFNEITSKLGLDKQWPPQLCQRTGLSLKIANVEAEGRVGVFSQIAAAIPLLQTGVLEQCIVGGVDTHLIVEHLELLDEYWRIKSERNVDGFTPGEAAAMLMLETEAHALARGVKPLAVIAGLGSGQEPEIFSSEKVSTGQGLAAAIRGSLATKSESHPVDKVYCDFTGESYYAFELGLIQSRLGATFARAGELSHPVEYYGDVGAASGGLLVVCAISDLLKKPKKQQDVLLWTTTDNGKRMALLLESVPAEQPQ